MRKRYLIDGINLALPSPVLERRDAPASDDSDIVDALVEALGTPARTDTGKALTALVFEAEDEHELRLLLSVSREIVAFSVQKRSTGTPPTCPEGWLNDAPQVLGTSTAHSYRGIPLLGAGWFRAYARSRDDASARLAANVAAALPTLCPGSCPPQCQCVPRVWTQEVITSSHRAGPRWLGIPVGGSWTSTATQTIRAYCK